MYVNQWVGDDLCNLLECTNGELYIIYDYMERHVIRRIANKYRELERLGKVSKPERSQPYEGPEAERELSAERRGRAQQGLGKSAVGKMVRLSVPEEFAHFHQQLQEALEEHGNLSKARFSEWQTVTKDAEGQAEVHDLSGTKFEVRFDSEQDALIEALRSVQPIKAPPASRTRRKEALKGPEKLRQDVACGDPHFGYYRMPNGELLPMHDENALSLFHQVCSDIQPEKIIIGGDLIDFAGLSHWEQLGSFIDTLNPTIKRAALFIDILKKDCPNSKLILIEGNHDQRPTKMRRVSPQVAELLKVTRPDEKYPVLSLDNLLDLEKRGIEFKRGGTARAQVNERLGVIHKGPTNKSIGRDWRSTVGFDGHSVNMPRPEVVTMPNGEVVTVMHYMLPMLGRIDGMLPSNTSTYDNYGQPDLEVKNWVQGFGIIDYLPGNAPFQVHTIYTNPHDGYKAYYGGRLYEPR